MSSESSLQILEINSWIHICSGSVDSFYCFLCCAEDFQLNIAFVVCISDVNTKESLLRPMLTNCSSMFSLSFMCSGPHLGLWILWRWVLCTVWAQESVSLFSIWIPYFPNSDVPRNHPFPIMSSWYLLSKISWLYRFWFISGLSILLHWESHYFHMENNKILQSYGTSRLQAE